MEAARHRHGDHQGHFEALMSLRTLAASLCSGFLMGIKSQTQTRRLRAGLETVHLWRLSVSLETVHLSGDCPSLETVHLFGTVFISSSLTKCQQLFGRDGGGAFPPLRVRSSSGTFSLVSVLVVRPTEDGDASEEAHVQLLPAWEATILASVFLHRGSILENVEVVTQPEGPPGPHGEPGSAGAATLLAGTLACWLDEKTSNVPTRWNQAVRLSLLTTGRTRAS